jgi:hypothetical protein
MVQAVFKENNNNAKVEYIKDVNELINHWIMGSPALLINDQPVKIGMKIWMPKSKEELLQIINKNLK